MKLFLVLNTFIAFNCIESENINNAIEKSRSLVEKFRTTEAIPGIVVGISYKGKQVWVESFGLSDIENDVKCRTDTVMRTGSVTKPINTALVSKLIENGTLNWDLDIHHYISENVFPKKEWNGEKVNITLRELLSMRAGIRTSDEQKDFRQLHNFHNVTETLKYFVNDPLVAKPGTKFFYSNFGWHLIGAILESVTHQNYEILMNSMFSQLKMNSTRLSRHEAIIPHRSRPYTRSKSSDGKHYVLHSAAVIEDLGRPLPWLPMGAIITSVPDLLTFTNVMINSYKNNDYLKSETVKELWTPILNNYGLGWYISKFSSPKVTTIADLQYIHHNGGVAGTVTMLGMIPKLNISVAVISNMGGVSIDSIGLSIINTFIDNIFE